MNSLYGKECFSESMCVCFVALERNHLWQFLSWFYNIKRLSNLNAHFEKSICGKLKRKHQLKKVLSNHIILILFSSSLSWHPHSMFLSLLFNHDWCQWYPHGII